MKKVLLYLPLLVLVHGVLLVSLSRDLRERPLEVKLGYLPHPQILKIVSADHRLLLAESAVLKVLFYFGTLAQQFAGNTDVRPEYASMYQTLQTALQLDPRNEDAYYFAQAAFTWELRRIDEVNLLLEQSLQARPWDSSVPFYLGFNHAYFLKDYAKAAGYMQRAAEISGNPLYAGLASRFLYEANQTGLGLAFLDGMIAGSKDKSLVRVYQTRRAALLAVTEIERGLAGYQRRFGRPAASIDSLVAAGLLAQVPADPYGGRFYLDDHGKVRSTSKFANPSQ